VVEVVGAADVVVDSTASDVVVTASVVVVVSAPATCDADGGDGRPEPT
jgi:hypothetical protein